MTTDITSLIGSRICHDLISPLGAIGNGLELLGMTLDVQGPEIVLIEDSVKNANARIRFFRIAFGHANEGQTIGRAEILSVLSGLAYGGRLSYVWQPEGDQDRRCVKIAFLVLLCLETALPLGGEVEITKTDDQWRLYAQGARVVVDPDLWENLQDGIDPENLTSALVQFGLLSSLLNQSKRHCSMSHNDGSITVTF